MAIFAIVSHLGEVPVTVKDTEENLFRAKRCRGWLLISKWIGKLETGATRQQPT
jgi:hypothetical protein